MKRRNNKDGKSYSDKLYLSFLIEKQKKVKLVKKQKVTDLTFYCR